MADNQNDQTLTMDPSSIIAGYEKMNRERKKWEDGTVEGARKTSQAVEEFIGKLGKFSDKAARDQDQAAKRMVRSWEMAAATAGQSSADKIRIRAEANIKALNLQGAAADKVRIAMEKLIKIENEAKRPGGGGGESFGQNPVFAFRAARDFFEGRTQFAQVALGRLVYSLSGASVAITAGAAAFAGLGVATFHAAKSLGTYADEISNAALRTGLTVAQVEQFGFAARTVGQDINVFEGAMRQLTSGVEDFSGEGDKARGAMAKMGVRTRDLMGEVRPTADILMDLSSGFNSIGDTFERNKLGMDIFKRKWLELAPAMLAVEEKVRRAKELGFGPTQEEIDRFSRIDDVLDEVSQRYAEFARKLKDGLVVSVALVFTPIESTLDKLAEMANKESTREVGRLRDPFTPDEPPRKPTTTEQMMDRMIRRGQEDQLRRHGADANRTIGEVGSLMAARELQSATSSRTEQMQIEASRLKALADESANRLRAFRAEGAIGAPVEKERTLFRERLSAYEKQLSLIKSITEAEAHRLAIAEALRRAEITAADHLLNRNLTPTGRAILEFSRHPGLRQPYEIQLPFGVIRTPEDMRLQRFRQIAAPELQEEFQAGVAKIQADIAKEVHDLTMDRVEKIERARASASRTRLRELDLEHVGLSIQIKTANEIRIAEERIAESRTRSAAILAADTPLNRLQTEVRLATIRQRAAFQDRADTESQARALEDLANARTEAQYNRYDPDQAKAADSLIAENRKNLDLRLFEAKSEHEKELFRIGSHFDEMRAQEVRHQLDDIKDAAASLFETLFTSPSKFGAQLASTLRAAVLRPVSEGFGERVAQGLRPTIFGQTGLGGIAGSLRGIFGGGGLAPIPVNSSTVSYPSTAPGFTGILPNQMILTLPPDFNGDFTGFSGIGGFPNFGGLGGAPGGTSGTFGPYSLGGFGGGRGLSLSSLRSSFWNSGSIALGGGRATTAVGIGGFGGKLTGGLTSQGAASLYTAVGLPLALAGLTGSRAGTWGGIGMGTLGGALTGAGIGTMILPGLGTAIGAGIGAAAGFGIGIGEKIAGVEPQWKQAERLVKTQYGISINRSVADQIVAIAKQKYGSTVSIAVRSPEVREMLGLYAAGTGQAGSYARSAASPYGASLVQSGGTLFQTPTTLYGNPFTHSSSLPVYGGNFGGGAYGGGGSPAPVYVSMNFDGRSAGDALTGKWVTPSLVQSRNASAWRGSQGRVQDALTLQEPGTIAS